MVRDSQLPGTAAWPVKCACLSSAMVPTAHCAFAARLTMLPETAAFADTFCARNAINHDDGLRLALIIEELFTNTVIHGHGGDCDAAVEVTLSKHRDTIAVLYEDCAPPYDPTVDMTPARPDPAADVEAQAESGLGVRLIGQLVCSARYEYADGKNRTWLELMLHA